jgi:hypothetical protein
VRFRQPNCTSATHERVNESIQFQQWPNIRFNAGRRETGSGMSNCLIEEPDFARCHLAQSLGISRTANVFPSWLGSLYKVIALSSDWRASATKGWRKLSEAQESSAHLYLPFTPSILYYKPSDFPPY